MRLFAAAIALLFLITGLAAPVSSTPRAPDTNGPLPRGAGAGIYSVAGSADYTFELTQGGNYYLTLVADSGSSIEAWLREDGSVVGHNVVEIAEARLVVLDAGTYDLHLEGSGKAAVGWDFVNSPGAQTFATDQRLVAALAPSGNRLTVSVLYSSAPSVRIFVYDDNMDLALDAHFATGESKTFDLPWAKHTWATLVAEIGVPGSFSLDWGATDAPVWQNSFMLPVPLGVIMSVLILVGIATALAVREARRRRSSRRS